MKTVIYLSNQNIKAVIGEVKRGVLIIEKTVSQEVPKLSIVNGQVTDDETFTEFLREFWQNHQLPRKKVCLVVNSTQTVVRFFEAPGMSHRKMMEYLPREFADVERMREPVFSYRILGPGKAPHRYRILGVVMERSFLTEHVRRFHSLGIHLVSVETALEAELCLLQHLEFLKDKVCAVQLFDGNTLMNILWANGSFVHFNRTRIPGTDKQEGLGDECVRAAGALNQFAKAEQIRDAITAVYLGGLEPNHLACCEKAIHRMNPHISVKPLSEAAGGAVRMAEDGKDFDELGGYAVPAGGLFAHTGRQNLLHQYRQNPEVLIRRQAWLRMAAPPAATAGILLVVLLIQAVGWFHLTNQIDDCLDYMSDPLVIAGAARYDRLTSENEILHGRIRATGQLQEAILSYPVMDTGIDRTVTRCARGLVTAEVTGFQADQGWIQINSIASDEHSIHQFIDRLAAEKNVFAAIDYTGFEYVESDHVWKVYVECYLSVPEKGNPSDSAGKEAVE